MSQWNIASFSKEEQDKVAVDRWPLLSPAGKDEQARRAGTC